MKQLFTSALALFFLSAMACDTEGTNISGNGSDSDIASNGKDVVRGGDASTEEIATEDPGPPFNDTLAWKVLDPGEIEMWNTMTGILNDDGSYSVFVGGGFGAVMWYTSAAKKWHHINLAQSVEVKSIWAASEDYIVIAGEDGLLKRYFDFSGSGSLEWYNDDLSTGLSTSLESIHGHDKDNIWAVGEAGGVLQFNGSWKKWTPAEVGVPDSPAPDFNAVLALGPEKALIAGDGILVEYSAGTFTVNDTEFADYKIRALHLAPDAIWLGADKGTLFKQLPDGTFEKHQANVYSQFKALWTSPEGVLYAAGTQTDPTVWLYDGNSEDSWDYLAVESPKFIKDAHPDLRIDPASRVTGLWGTGEQNIYACTKEKQVVHYAVHK
jgi:hypothetical protein